MKRILLILVLCQILIPSVQADVKLPALFSDNALLQANRPVPVWGLADPGEPVTIRFAGQVVKATAATNGHWSATLEPMKAGCSGDMTVEGKNSVVVSNVLVGTVWVCSGQSNMEMGILRVRDAKEEIAKANYPRIRLFLVKRAASLYPQANVEARWVECSPSTVVQDGWQGFSAVAYFFGRAVHLATGQPVGLIESSWGGTPAQSWTSLEGLRKVPELKDYVDGVERNVSNMPALLAKYEKEKSDLPQAVARWQETVRKPWLEAIKVWEQKCAQARLEHKPLPARPRLVPGEPRLGDPPDKPHVGATALFNAMIRPLIPFAIEGAIWYQGESNAYNEKLAHEYSLLFPAMIRDWRLQWGAGDFPFYFCQLANFMGKQTEPRESNWAILREGQRKALALPNTGMACLIDLGEAGDIHPINKQDVGDRLAKIALAKTFGQDVRYTGPVYRSMTVEGDKVRLNFDPAGGELVARDLPATYPVVLARSETRPLVRNRPGSQLEGFAICGADHAWVWADARIDGQTVWVSAPEVKQPVAVRYGWADNPTCNLYNEEGFPASPFEIGIAPASRSGEHHIQAQATRDTKAGFAGESEGQNRPPLQPLPFLRLPIGSIVPKGWLRHQLELDASGLTGRIQEISPYVQFGETGWVKPSQPGGEEVSYWLRGYGDLAYMLNDSKMIAEARKWITAVIATQDADGYFGPTRLKPKSGDEKFPDPWAHTPMLSALRSNYEFTGNKDALGCLTRYFMWLNTLPVKYFETGWAAARWADTLDTIYWLYNNTGEAWLLTLSSKIHENSKNWTGPIPSKHNVNIAQGIRQPAEYWQQAKEGGLLAITEKTYRQVMDEFGQFPGGGFAGDEVVRRGYGDPRQGFETCGIVEFMRTFEIMTRITGNPLWADRNEEIAFNTFPAALTPDHRAIHYITPANVIQLDDRPKTKGQFQNHFAMLAFKPGARRQYRCCPHNYGMGWPYYTEEIWQSTPDRGLCAMLYAPSEVNFRVGGGGVVKIEETTDYPFDEKVEFLVRTPKPMRFPLYFRIPGWCAAPTLTINGNLSEVRGKPGSFHVIEREWSDGDRAVWTMPMSLSVHVWAVNKNAVSISRGPLNFALDMGEKWEKDKSAGKPGDCGTDVWPQWKVTATKPWNYALVLKGQGQDIEVVRSSASLATNPFTPETAPVRLCVKARRISQWSADKEQVVSPLPPSPVSTDAMVESVTLIPMGAARLRISAFPTTGGESR